jgi:hypothetical protein
LCLSNDQCVAAHMVKYMNTCVTDLQNDINTRVLTTTFSSYQNNIATDISNNFTALSNDIANRVTADTYNSKIHQIETKMGNYHLVVSNCYWTGWVNQLDGEFHFNVPDTYHIMGVHSKHWSDKYLAH